MPEAVDTSFAGFVEDLGRSMEVPPEDIMLATRCVVTGLSFLCLSHDLCLVRCVQSKEGRSGSRPDQDRAGRVHVLLSQIQLSQNSHGCGF